jgi:hypothetical protein
VDRPVIRRVHQQDSVAHDDADQKQQPHNEETLIEVSVSHKASTMPIGEDQRQAKRVECGQQYEEHEYHGNAGDAGELTEQSPLRLLGAA